MIHHLADVQSAAIGEGTSIWQFCVVLKNAVIGSNCNICSNSFIEDDVVIGDNVTIKNGVYVWNGLRIGDNVFVGPCVAFTNDIYPRSKHRGKPVPTIVKKGVSIGANATIKCGITVGEYAMIGMGAVVTRDVPPYALVMGNPAKITAWVDESGRKLARRDENSLISPDGVIYLETKNGLQRQ